MKFRALSLAAAAVATACAHPGPPPANPSSTTAVTPGPASAAVAPEPKAPLRLMDFPLQLHPEFAEDFAAERVSGGIAIYDSESNLVRCSDEARCRLPHHPASTFKIANSIIALETGVVTEPETMLPWDGTTRDVPEWNQDLTLRSAIRVSCVPCFQKIAREVGEARMREWVQKLEYGNQDISGGIAEFWLTGGLRITALEELDFLRRLEEGKLPIQPFVREMVIDMLTVDVGADYVLRGKTGLIQPPETTELIGWFVGWVERGKQRIYFATAIDAHEADVDILKVRRRVTERVLKRIGVLPA